MYRRGQICRSRLKLKEQTTGTPFAMKQVNDGNQMNVQVAIMEGRKKNTKIETTVHCKNIQQHYHGTTCTYLNREHADLQYGGGWKQWILQKLEE